MDTPKPKEKRTRLKLLEWFSFFFTILAVILFGTAVFLNRSYHRTSLRAVRSDLLEELQEAAQALKSGILAKEEFILQLDVNQVDTFLAHKDITVYTTIEPYHIEEPNKGLHMISPFMIRMNTYIASNMYDEALSALSSPFTETAILPPGLEERIIQVPTRVVPFFLRNYFTPSTVLPESTSDIISHLQRYRESKGANGNAKRALVKVARTAPITPERAMVALWSNLHLLELSNNKDIKQLYYILYLLFERRDIQISDETTESIENLLVKMFPDYSEHKSRSHSAWTIAKQLTSRASNTPPPVRMMLEGKIVSSVRSGSFLTYRLNWIEYLPRMPYIQLSVKNRTETRSAVDLPLTFMPGYKFWISHETFDVQSKAINKQYLVINTLLGVLLILIVLFIVGTVRVIREENDLAHLRSRFIATVSHELRTPLSLIQLYSETLFEGRIDNKKQNDYLQTIVAETQRLTGLVNNVIDFSRLENRVRILSYSNSNLSELSWNVIREFKYRLNLEGFRINVNIGPDVRARVDPQAFCRVLFNLLDNAIKYSEKDRYLALTLNQTEKFAVLTVTDHGIGIPIDAKPFVYLDYYRVDDSRVASQRGSGIGLSVVKQLLDGMHARIEMSDSKPTGTTFTVTIPRDTEKDTEA